MTSKAEIAYTFAKVGIAYSRYSKLNAHAGDAVLYVRKPEAMLTGM